MEVRYVEIEGAPSKMRGWNPTVLIRHIVGYDSCCKKMADEMHDEEPWVSSVNQNDTAEDKKPKLTFTQCCDASEPYYFCQFCGEKVELKKVELD